jgi:protein-tyrosine phosphatase
MAASLLTRHLGVAPPAAPGAVAGAAVSGAGAGQAVSGAVAGAAESGAGAGQAVSGATIRSAGTRATLTGSPREVVAVMASAGLDVSGHVSRQLDVGMLADADLVVGMAREHVRDAVLLDPPAFRRTFTLKELLRRAGVAGAPAPGTTLAEWLAVLAEGRTTAELLGSSTEDDVADPMGLPLRAYELAAAELDQLTATLARYLGVLAVTDQPGAAR